MGKRLNGAYPLLIKFISAINGVVAIGNSGGETLPENGESDIDLYIFCQQIPDVNERQAAIQQLGDNVFDSIEHNEHSGRFWGTIDFLQVDNTEICVMYFTTEYMDNEIASVLNGTRPDKEAGVFYPTGRCATMLSMFIMYDPVGYIAGVKERLAVFPQELSKRLFLHHINKANDTESFSRAVLREDVLFYHETAERAIDHFLQALFALNQCFFPSRKRSIQFINSFSLKPLDCVNRLLKMVELGAKPETLCQSLEIWFALFEELRNLIQ